MEEEVEEEKKKEKVEEEEMVEDEEEEQAYPGDGQQARSNNWRDTRATADADAWENQK